MSGIPRLDAIAARKRREVAAARVAAPAADVKAEALRQAPPRDFLGALRAEGFAVIGEIKRASPAAGRISDDVDAAAMARRFVAGGAAALAVWTDGPGFNGDPELLRAMRGACDVPVLRKDFILEPYQLYESRAIGADAVMLIAAILDPRTLRSLLELSSELGMAAPVSVHREVDVDRAVAAGAQIVFVHNRNVETFDVDLGVTMRFRPRIPQGILVVSESGISTPADIARLRGHADAVLVGTGLMASDDPTGTVGALRAAALGPR